MIRFFIIIFILFFALKASSQEIYYNNFNNNQLIVDLKAGTIGTKFGDTTEVFSDCKSVEYKYCLVTPSLAIVIPVDIEKSWKYGSYSFSVIQNHSSYKYMGKELGRSLWIRADSNVKSQLINAVRYDLLYSLKYGLVYFTRSSNSKVIDVWVLASEVGVGVK